MEKLELEVEKRSLVGKQVKQLRDKGLVPAILYGHRTEPVPLQVEERSLRRVLSRAGSHHLVTLILDGKTRMSLAREVQEHPITKALLHADFYEVVMTEKITTEVPLIFVGSSPVVERKEGLLMHGLDSIEVECLPSDLTEAIEVDVSKLAAVDQAITVGDLEIGPGIEVLTEKGELVARILPMEEEKEEEVVAVEEVAPAEVEVITRPREEEEEKGEQEKE